MDRDDLEDLVYRVIGAMIEVHKQLGPGFVESVYHRALEIELACRSIPFESEKDIKVRYRGKVVGDHQLDMLVAGELVVELKAVDTLHAKHYAQVRSYLRAVDRPVGLLANFDDTPLDCRRVELKDTPQ